LLYHSKRVGTGPVKKEEIVDTARVLLDIIKNEFVPVKD
jgi:hypothetical protein